jgi:hypothetical protein
MTTLCGYTSVMPIAAPKKKRTLLPLLTVLFVISYGLMTVLIVEQGSVIQSQGNLIKVLLRDSTELWAAKGKAIADGQAARSQAQSRGQNPSTQAPSTQAVPQQRSQNQAGKVAKPGPHFPPVPASELADQRRSLRTI